MRRRNDLGDYHKLRFPPAHTQQDTQEHTHRQVPIAIHTAGHTHMHVTSRDVQVTSCPTKVLSARHLHGQFSDHLFFFVVSYDLTSTL